MLIIFSSKFFLIPKFFCINLPIILLSKFIYYPFSLITDFLSFLIINFINFIKKVYKKTKKNNIKKNQKKITPNLTLYYPLPTSILSVSIRFMGTILLILIFFCISFFLLLTIYQINFKILILVFTIILYIIISCFVYHNLESLSHFLKNDKLEIESILLKITENKIFLKIEFFARKFLIRNDADLMYYNRYF